jgi:hypothetical protein
MNYTVEKRDVMLCSDYNVIVAGGGPAGIAAAISAAREGKRVALLEASGALGGMSTMGLVPSWCPFSDGEKIVYRGIAERIMKELKAQMPHIPEELVDWVAIDPEKLKLLYDKLMQEYNVRVLFNITICGADVENGRIKAILAAHKCGISAFTADTFIDCTGDADLARFAGAQFLPDDIDIQPSSHCFMIGGVDPEAYNKCRLYGGLQESPIRKMIDSGRYPEIKDTHMCVAVIEPGIIGFNAGHIWDIDPSDPFSMSDALAEGRRIADAIYRGLREFEPEAFGRSYIVQTAPLMGIRQSRRVKGDYIIGIDDYIARRSFEDEIGRCCYYIDIHPPKSEVAESTDAYIGAEKRAMHYGKGESYGIPYRCLTPAGLDNLLVAGRSISSDNTINASLRVMPPCFVTGEAAGIAAALSQGNVHSVDTARLREKLTEYGAYIK